MRNFKIAIAGIFAVVGLASAFAIGWQFSAHYTTLSELRVHQTNLMQDALTPQLREYLKSRIYFLAAGLPERDLADLRIDFGPVKEEFLGGTTGIKGPESESDTYSLAKLKGQLSRTKP
jgi:hypothetical protein